MFKRLIKFKSFVSVLLSFFPNVFCGIEISSLVLEIEMSVSIFLLLSSTYVREKSLDQKFVEKNCWRKLYEIFCR